MATVILSSTPCFRGIGEANKPLTSNLRVIRWGLAIGYGGGGGVSHRRGKPSHRGTLGLSTQTG